MRKEPIVYLLKTVDDNRTLYKIGHSKTSLHNRVKALQTGSPYTIDIVTFYESKYASNIETSLHNLYSYKRLSGEWFELDVSDEVNFYKMCEKYHNLMILINTKNNDILCR